jgi:hypothetical protein
MLYVFGYYELTMNLRRIRNGLYLIHPLTSSAILTATPTAAANNQVPEETQRRPQHH